MKLSTQNFPNRTGQIRILLVEDHPFTRIGMRHFLDGLSDMRVCGEASEPRDVMLQLASKEFDLVISDLNLPGKGGLELIKDIHALHPQLPVLVVSMYDEPQFAPRVLRAGARGYLMKNESADVVASAIREVIRGRLVVSERMSSLILDIFAGKQSVEVSVPEARLSDREVEILLLLGSAQGTRSIAQRLSISMKTVEAHRTNIRRKLGLPSSQELLRYAVCWVAESGRGSRSLAVSA
ncbi:MAG: response regulator transcription factor [Verrucomicrobiota bacterium]